MADASPPVTDSTPAPPFDSAAEYRMAWWLAGAVLLTLTLVKPLGGIPLLGTAAFTFAAILQLYLPLWRAGKLDRDYDFAGLHFSTWRADAKLVLILCAITFPLFVAGHHLYMVYGHDGLTWLGLDSIAQLVPRRTLAPAWPASLEQWLTKGWWLLQTVATHTLGVALPEETFYRGYIQPQFQQRWKPRWRIFGVRMGWASVVAAALFAAGHYLGEWNPLRFGPFFPALLFAWQRNATGSVVGSIAFHAACNILGEVLFSLYTPT
jgi:membrane protease YdiL (CAAX protease family)